MFTGEEPLRGDRLMSPWQSRRHCGDVARSIAALAPNRHISPPQFGGGAGGALYQAQHNPDGSRAASAYVT